MAIPTCSGRFDPNFERAFFAVLRLALVGAPRTDQTENSLFDHSNAHGLQALNDGCH